MLSSERGAELIEFALVLPLLLLLSVGMVDFGMLFQRFHVVTNAAREGARVSVLPGYAVADVEARVNQFLAASGLTETATIDVGAVVCLPVGDQFIAVRPVTVEYPYEYTAVGSLAGYFGTAFTRSGVRATATMRSELAAAACS
jgi:Flp pilus assembly protein TadG